MGPVFCCPGICQALPLLVGGGGGMLCLHVYINTAEYFRISLFTPHAKHSLNLGQMIATLLHVLLRVCIFNA